MYIKIEHSKWGDEKDWLSHVKAGFLFRLLAGFYRALNYINITVMHCNK